MRIARVEDDAEDAAQILRPLQAFGHMCRVFSTGSSFLKSIPVDAFDAVILARDLPDMSGLDVLDAVRPRNQALPIMVVRCTVHGEAIDLAPRHFHWSLFFVGKPGILLSRNYLLEV